MIRHRRRFKQVETFRDRLTSFANVAREVAKHLPAGTEKDEMLRKARQADTAARIEKWAKSPGLRPPK